MPRPEYVFPSREEADEAREAGRADALANRPRRPEWDRPVKDFTEGCLRWAYLRGYNRGMQELLQERFGDPPY